MSICFMYIWIVKYTDFKFLCFCFLFQFFQYTDSNCISVCRLILF